jgi:uncharacterized protein DUF4314
MTVSDLRARMEKELVGKRIELIHTDDPYTKLVPGDKGIVTLVDEMPFNDTPIQISVKWDSGSNLMMIWGKDQYKVIKE